MTDPVQSVSELAVQVAKDPALQERIKADPATTIANLAAPLQSDIWIYRIVVLSLGSVAILSLVFAFVLALRDKKDPDIHVLITALGSAAVGALAGLLAPSPVARK